MRGSWFENDYMNHLILLDSRPANTRDLFELNNHRLGMFASVTFKRALIVGRLVGWLDTSKPHLTPAPWAWREINRLERIMNMRLLHSYAPTSSGGSTIGLSVTDAWDRAAVSVMLARCSRTTAESIRERLETRRRRQMSKWNSEITLCPLLALSRHH